MLLYLKYFMCKDWELGKENTFIATVLFSGFYTYSEI